MTYNFKKRFFTLFLTFVFVFSSATIYYRKEAKAAVVTASFIGIGVSLLAASGIFFASTSNNDAISASVRNFITSNEARKAFVLTLMEKNALASGAFALDSAALSYFKDTFIDEALTHYSYANNTFNVEVTSYKSLEDLKNLHVSLDSEISTVFPDTLVRTKWVPYYAACGCQAACIGIHYGDTNPKFPHLYWENSVPPGKPHWRFARYDVDRSAATITHAFIGNESHIVLSAYQDGSCYGFYTYCASDDSKLFSSSVVSVQVDNVLYVKPEALLDGVYGTGGYLKDNSHSVSDIKACIGSATGDVIFSPPVNPTDLYDKNLDYVYGGNVLTGVDIGAGTVEPEVPVDPDVPVKPDLGGITGLLSSIHSAIISLPTLLTGDMNINFDALRNGNFTKKFPFCIPFDFYNCIKQLVAPPVAPVFDLSFAGTIMAGAGSIVLDMNKFDGLAKIIRFFVFFGFVAGLIKLTRQLIKG